MRSVTCSMGVSADGYIVGPDGTFDWSVPDDEMWDLVLEEIRGVGVHLLGRRLYETMRFWETAAADPSLGPREREWAALWNPLPKVVFSTTLTSVDPSARLVTGGPSTGGPSSGSLAEEIERLRAEPVSGEIAIGGATLATEAARLGLVDEYRIRVHPVLVGGGTPFFDRRAQRVDLELLGCRTLTGGVLHLRYAVRR